MLKLLSRSKHEEFKSDLALQIRDEKERRAENAENLELQEIPTRTVHAPNTIHPMHCSSCCPFLLFDAVCCLQFFWFLPILSLVIAYELGCFCNFPLF